MREAAFTAASFPYYCRKAKRDTRKEKVFVSGTGKESGMKSQNKKKLFIIGLGIICIIFFLYYKERPGIGRAGKEYKYTDEYVQIKELPPLLDFYYYSREEWEEKIAEQEFGDTVTPAVVSWILEQTGSAQYISYDAADNSIDRAGWNEIYGKLLDLLDTEGAVRMADEVILKKDGNTLVCASGTYKFNLEKLETEPMAAVSFYIKEDRIIGVHSLKSKAALLQNVYVKKADEEKIEFLAKGETYTLPLALKDPAKTAGHVCDLIWENGQVAKVSVKEDTIQGDLIAVDEGFIEIEGYGKINRSAELPVYKTYGTVEEKDISDIVIANMSVKYVVAADKVEAVLLAEPAQLSRIRVLLLGEDGGPYHGDVCIQTATSATVVKDDGESKVPAGTLIRASEWFGTGGVTGIRITPEEENGELFLCDGTGAPLSKGYQGILELRHYPEGYAVVSELAIEQYLCSVVPSEMPSRFEKEALKAQAVCARSYAYIQLERGDYAAFGAHVDDSTNYQVYNKQDRDEKTTAAVWDTAGMVLSYEGETAEAYYFSTSAGVTGNGDAWNLTADPKYGYLHSGLVKQGGGKPDLSDEQAFAGFIAAVDASFYESAMPYFRWNAVGDYSSKEIQNKIRDILTARKERTPQDIVFLNRKKKQADSIKNFGKLQSIKVAKRSANGVVLQLKLKYKKGTVLVGNEYNIRALLGAGVTELVLADGSKKETALLPSAYTTLTQLENGTYAMSGGGYGHGIGMSQNGAGAMAAEGKTCEEILKFFFSGIELKAVPGEGGAN
ncbi:SpoIID/LytB domain-containing protein [Lachnospiraceae bacterium]|nr:SpoIID/LytB domain-containing protein [Lachnospiraceae bacterium]